MREKIFRKIVFEFLKVSLLFSMLVLGIMVLNILCALHIDPDYIVMFSVIVSVVSVALYSQFIKGK